MQTWNEPVPIEIPEELIAVVGGHPIVAEILAHRGINKLALVKGFLDPDFYIPSSPDELPGLMKANDRLEKAIHQGERILVWGDFDVDGQTSTALLVSILRELDANVEFHLPIRATESHGVNLTKLKQLLEKKPRPDIVLTCDTGIAARKAVSYAKSIGVDFVVTDHHEIPEILPDAAALVNPNFLAFDHPMRTLPGVGVAYELAKELCHRFDQEEIADNFLDLAALGIIADVASLRGDTRYLAQLGLRLLRKSQRIGILTLLESAGVEANYLTEENIGFSIAPRLNAIGRLGDANPVVELFTTEDRVRARKITLQLEVLNRRRQLLTGQVYQAALKQIEHDRRLLDPAVLVLSQAGWPAGIVGIVASRLVERFGKPTILISVQPDGKGRGSARSIEGVDITRAIASQKRLLDSFGGHPMAAGLSLKQENIPVFRQGVSHTVEKTGIPPESALQIESYLDWEELDLDFVNEIERLAPFGAGNPPIIFASRGLILSKEGTMGQDDRHLSLSFSDKGGKERSVIWWNGADEWASIKFPKGPVDLAYTIRRSSYQGKLDVGIQYIGFRPAEDIQEIRSSKHDLQILDKRLIKNPLIELKILVKEKAGIQIWAEGTDGEELQTKGYQVFNREQLSASGSLAIWTTPPGPNELRQVIQNISPLEVIVFGLTPEEATPQAFLSRLLGLVKFAIKKKDGKVSIHQLAALLAGSEQTVRVGLEWLQAKGNIQILEENCDGIILERGMISDSVKAEYLKMKLESILKQSAAYRSYFQRANIDKLLQVEE